APVRDRAGPARPGPGAHGRRPARRRSRRRRRRGHRRRHRAHRRGHPRRGRGGREPCARRHRREPVRPGDRMTLSVITNPFAGGGRAARELNGVEASLRRLGLDHHVERTRSLDHARELALAAAQAGETAVAFGGDGLIGAVGDALRHTDGVLGVLPGGRGNDFVRMLGISTSPQAACEVLAHGEVRRLDLGIIGDRSFIGIASCGFDSEANRIANETTLVRGRLVYAYGLLRALAGWRPATFTISVDGGPARTMTGYTVAVANSRYYGGGMMLAPDATLQDG